MLPRRPLKHRGAFTPPGGGAEVKPPRPRFPLDTVLPIDAYWKECVRGCVNLLGGGPMRTFVVIAAIAVAAYLIYTIWSGEEPRSRQREGASPAGVVEKIIKQGGRIGDKTGDAYRSVDPNR